MLVARRERKIARRAPFRALISQRLYFSYPTRPVGGPVGVLFTAPVRLSWSPADLDPLAASSQTLEKQHLTARGAGWQGTRVEHAAPRRRRPWARRDMSRRCFDNPWGAQPPQLTPDGLRDVLRAAGAALKVRHGGRRLRDGPCCPAPARRRVRPCPAARPGRQVRGRGALGHLGGRGLCRRRRRGAHVPPHRAAGARAPRGGRQWALGRGWQRAQGALRAPGLAAPRARRPLAGAGLRVWRAGLRRRRTSAAGGGTPAAASAGCR